MTRALTLRLSLLCDEAAAAGDREQVKLCEVALGHRDMTLVRTTDGNLVAVYREQAQAMCEALSMGHDISLDDKLSLVFGSL